MKKTIITLLALAGVAMGEGIAFNTTNSITLSAATGLGSHTTAAGWEQLDSKDEASAAVTNLLKEAEYGVLTTNNAWYYFSGAANTSTEQGDYVFENGAHVLDKKTVDNQGTILTYTLDVSTLFSSEYTTDYTQMITGITITTSTGETVGDNYYTAVAIAADGTVTCLTGSGINGNDLRSKKDLTLSNLNLGVDDKIMVLYRHGKDNKSVITGVTFAATGTAVQNVPEPATATLSLLALASLAARRRRK